jgi:dihydropyrimidinase
MSQLLIRNGTCVCPGATVEADLLVDEGQIVAIGRDLGVAAQTVIDAQSRLVLPGGIDVHVHMPWPYGEYVSADDIDSGTKAAAFGGVTSVLDFAIPHQDESLEAALGRKLSAAAGSSWVDYSFHLNIRGEVEGKIAEIPRMIQAGFPSFKVFMAYEGFRLDDSQLLRVMAAVGRARGMLTVHSENGPLADHLTAKLIAEGKTRATDYPQARPALCEIEANNRLLTYVRLLGTRTHIHHVGTLQGAELIGKARREGHPVTGETCPHYLLFNSADLADDLARAAYLVCAPSIKGPEDQTALWRHLAVGDLSVVATDHCPYWRRQKEEHVDDLTRIPGGIGGVETRLSLIFTEGVQNGRLSLERFVDIWATEPARIFGLYPQKGVIAVGSDADLVIVDPSQKGVLRAADLHMNTDCLPYEGWEVHGLMATTILRGRILVEEGQLVAAGAFGELVPRYLTD